MAPSQNQIIVGSERGEATINVQKILDRPWYKYKHLRKLYLWLSVVLVVQATNGFDGSLINGLQALTYWQDYFHHPTGAQLGVAAGTQGLGGVVSQFFLWWLVEKIGRRYTILLGSVIIMLGVFLQTFSTSLAMFTAARAVIGFGLSFEYTAAPMLISELAHPQHRAQLSTLLNTLYNFGSMIAAWVCLGTLTIQSDWSWRSVSLLQMFPSVISLTLTAFVPESPRWLVARGQPEKAYRILVDHHCGGDESDPLASFELHEIQNALTFEKENGSGSWLDLFRTPGNRYRTWIVFTCAILSQATGQTLIGYYFVVVLNGIGVTNARTQNCLNGGLTTWNMLWAFWGAYVIDKFGRRRMMLTSLVLMLVIGYLPWTIANAVYVIHGIRGAGYAVIACIFLFNASYSSTWNGILTGYTVEVMNYETRAKLLCCQNLLVQATITGFNYLNPVALKNLSWRYYIIIDCTILLAIVVVYFTYPETSKITLEEVNVIFDGKNAIRGNILEKEEVAHEEHGDEKKGIVVLSAQPAEATA